MASLWTKFTDIFTRSKAGVVPQAPSGTGTTKFLREDGTWAVPSGGGGGGSSTLADLEDVNLNNPSDGQNLSYNATSQKWENKTPSSGEHNYSTTEQVVGTWIDGKPVYEIVKEFHPTSQTLTNVSYPHSIPNIDKICRWEGYMIWDNGVVHNFNDFQFYNSGVNVAGCSFAQVGLTDITIMTGTNRSSATVRFIIQYTKTTD